MVGGPHACEGVHAATAAPWPVSAAQPTGRAWPVAGGPPTWGVGWPQAGLVGKGCQKLGDEASRVHGEAVQAEGWGECQGDRENEPSEGQRSEGRPVGEPGLRNLEKGRDPDTGGAGSWGSQRLPFSARSAGSWSPGPPVTLIQSLVTPPLSTHTCSGAPERTRRSEELTYFLLPWAPPTGSLWHPIVLRTRDQQSPPGRLLQACLSQCSLLSWGLD